MDLNDIQVIIVNDGSSDDSLNIINSFVKKYPSFLCINNKSPSGGAGKPRNIGMQYVEANYLMLMDADDRLDENYCEVLYNQIVKENSNVVACNFKTFYDENTFNYSKNMEISCFNPLNYPINSNNIPFPIWGKIYDVNFLKDNNISFVNQDWEDLLFFSLVCFYNDSKITFFSKYEGYLYNKIMWGQTYSSDSKSLSINGLLNRIDTLNILINFSKRNNNKVFGNVYVFLISWLIDTIFFVSLEKKDFNLYLINLKKIFSDIDTVIRLPTIHSFIKYLILHENYNLIYMLNVLKFKYVFFGFNRINEKVFGGKL